MGYLELKNLTVEFSGFRAVNEVNMTIEKGAQSRGSSFTATNMGKDQPQRTFRISRYIRGIYVI